MSVIDEVKQRLDVLDVVGGYVRLQKAGRNYKAACPFHSERTPSFFVFPDRQTWRCFGACAEGGDIFAFVMKKEGVEFPEALRILAERAGVPLRREPDGEGDQRRARLREVVQAAASFFRQALAGESGGAARAYLAERQVSRDAVDAFHLGYAPDSWDALLTHLRGRGFEPAQLLEAGVVVQGDRGIYDRFRHRLMFTVRDERGRICGFAGRVLPGAESSGAKYVNTPQTPIFDKGGLIYGLDLAAEAIRRERLAVIVEGYMDVIAAHQHGFANVVATMGTALTERQVGLIKRYSRNLVLALDPDAAGSEATLRDIEVVTEAGDREAVPVPTWRGIVAHQETLATDIRVIALPDSRDPDELIRSEPETWRRLVQDAKPVLDHLFEARAARADVDSPRGRSQLVDELLPVVGAVADSVVQAHYLQRLARLARVDEDTLRQRLRPSGRPRRRGGIAEAPAPARPDSRRTGDAREEFCLAILFRYPEVRQRGEQLSADLFTLSEYREIFRAWQREPDPEAVRAALPEELAVHLEAILNRRLPVYGTRQALEALQTCVWRLEQRTLELQKRASTAAVLETVPASASVIEEARRLLVSGEQTGEEEIPALLVEDMESGRRLHRRLLDLQRNPSSGEVQE